MAMNDANEAVKRKEPEPVTAEPEVKAETPKTEEKAEAPKIAVAVKPAAASEPEAKRLKPTPIDPAVIRKQIEYYLSDDNLRHDKFFHDKISENKEGWLELALIMSCNKMKAMRATSEDVLGAIKDSKIEIKEDKLSVRRPGNLALPTLEAKPLHQKKSSAHAHDGGVICVIKDIPAEQSWMQIKEKLREVLPDKVQLWFVSEVSDKQTCIVASAPFEDDLEFFGKLEIDVGGTMLKTTVAHGDVLQQALKVMPKHIRDKREKEVRKRQKERNRPIVIGGLRFVTVHALRTRVKEILNSRSDGEQLKVDGSDFKLIKALLNYHPKGESKSKGMTGIKVATSSQGDNRCFWMLKETGDAEDFSAQKCLSAVEANPPYVEIEKPAAAPKASPEKKAPEAEKKPEDEKPKAEAAAADVKKEEAPAEAKKEAPAEEKKEEKKEEASTA